MSLRKPSTLYCPSCAQDRPISQMTVNVSKYEQQILTACKACQVATKPNERALNSAKASRYGRGA